VLGKGIPNRPGLFVELRSHFLHTHPKGPPGACEETLCWIRNHLLYDRDERTVYDKVSFEAVPSFAGGSACGLARRLGADTGRRPRRLLEAIY
jgi:hypothetical protein